MDRRVSGVLLLLIAVVLVVIVPRVLDPGEPGAASRAPLPLPPPVGTCLRGPDNDVAPCEELHDSEVIAAWVAGDPNRPRRSDVTPCWDAADEYLGEPASTRVGTWERYGAAIEVQVVRAPQAERVGRLGWKVCVVTPAFGGQSSGSAAGVGASGHRQGAFAACSIHSPIRVVTAFPNVNCEQAHGSELLGWAYGFRPDEQTPEVVAGFPIVPTDEEYRAHCQDLAVELLATDDPSYDGALVVETLIESSAGTDSPSGAREVGGKIISAVSVSGMHTMAVCFVRSADERLLLDSVIGLGDREVPLQ